MCVYIHIYILFYKRVKSEAAVNWDLMKINRCSGLKLVKIKRNVGQQTDLVVGCYWLCCWAWKCLVMPYWARRLGVVSVRRVVRGWPVQRPSRATECKGAK